MLSRPHCSADGPARGHTWFRIAKWVRPRVRGWALTLCARKTRVMRMAPCSEWDGRPLGTTKTPFGAAMSSEGTTLAQLPSLRPVHFSSIFIRTQVGPPAFTDGPT